MGEKVKLKRGRSGGCKLLPKQRLEEPFESMLFKLLGFFLRIIYYLFHTLETFYLTGSFS